MRHLTPAVLFLLVTTGCEPADTDLETAFCDVLGQSNAEAVTATADTSGAPEVAFEDVRVEIDLIEADSMFSGTVAYTPDEAGSFAFGFDEDVPVTVVEAGGSPLPWVNEVSGAACAELAVRRTVQLGLDTVYLEIGPTPVGTVALVAEESDDDL